MLAAAHEKAAAVLGEIEPVDVPPELGAPYATLTSPTSWLVVGHGCGEVASDPRGLSEARALAIAGRLDLLRNASRGPNPEGRVHAALQLVKASKPLSAEDIALVDRVRAATPTVQGCHGCSSGTAPIDDVLPAPAR